MRMSWSMKAYRQLRTMPTTKAAVKSLGEVVKSHAEGMSSTGAEYRIFEFNKPYRYGLQVQTKNDAAARDNATHNSLLKALGEL